MFFCPAFQRYVRVFCREEVQRRVERQSVIRQIAHRAQQLRRPQEQIFKRQSRTLLPYAK